MWLGKESFLTPRIFRNAEVRIITIALYKVYNFELSLRKVVIQAFDQELYDNLIKIYVVGISFLKLLNN